MLEKSNKIEISEDFMAMWRDEQTLWDVISPLKSRQKLKRQKFEKNVIYFRFFQADIFE